ncbi:MAG: nucleotidyl transferase AbiEii/AbiGii toxin family protein [Bdellovibrionales bacterium]
MFLYEHPDFEDLLAQTARAIGIPFSFVEKDYWVTYVLFRLCVEGVDDFVFKGGTSLTKAWGLLDRFSEDIDLLFTPHTKSKDQKRTRLKKINAVVSGFRGLTFAPDLSESHGHYRADCFRYHRFEGQQLGPLLPHIKLEMGYRGGEQPNELRPIQSYLGKQLVEAGAGDLAEDVLPFEVPVLDIRRTFVEKLFAIHSAFTNGEVKKYFRHYYDVYKLLGIDTVHEFVGKPEFEELKTHVAEMCREFPNTRIPAGLDFSRSMAFKSEPALIKTLAEALKEQRGLFFTEPPTADEIMQRISARIFAS